jgi:hypothetical protein
LEGHFKRRPWRKLWKFLKDRRERFRKRRSASRGRLSRQSVGWQMGWLEARDRDCLLAITQLKKKATRKAAQDLVRTLVGRWERSGTGRSRDENKL